MKSDCENSWEKEFREFTDSVPVEPPLKLSQNIRSIIESELNPAPWKIFSKLIFITSISGAVSLIICPQFGLGKSMELMMFFMQFGHTVCSIACGSIYMALGTLLSVFLLRPEELRVFRNTRLLQFFALSLLTLGAFICAGAEIFISVAVFWIFGAVLGGIVVLEVSYQLKLAALKAI